MFWGCSAGPAKGPCLFWEEKWNSLNSKHHCERKVPLVIFWMEENSGFTFMQDGAPSHSAARMIAELSWVEFNQLFGRSAFQLLTQ